MERILILGCCGAGKSTLARQLGDVTGLPVIHLDALFWKENWVESTREEIDSAIENAIKGDKWIIDGNYSRTIPMRLSRCDGVVFLDLPRYKCICGVIKRVIKHYGKCRPDMGKNCPERLNFPFLKYVWDFKKKQKPKVLRYLNGANVPIYMLKSHKECDAFLEKFGN